MKGKQPKKLKQLKVCGDLGGAFAGIGQWENIADAAGCLFPYAAFRLLMPGREGLDER